MAWQIPKTDWIASDGVRDDDFNRIEGNIEHLYNMTARNALTIYVSPTGSDSTGAGTSSAPYATIQHAISMLPKNTNGQTVTINVAAGTYNEDVILADFNGYISITGAYDASVTIKSLTVRACACFISSIHLRVTAGVTVTYGATLMSNSKITISGGLDGVSVNRGSTCIINAALNVSGITGVAVAATNASNVYVLSFTVSGAAVLLEAQQGSIISYGSTNHTVTAVAFITRTGGRIYSGAQSQLPSA